MDELPETRNFEKTASDLTAHASVDFEIILPLCLDEVKISAAEA